MQVKRRRAEARARLQAILRVHLKEDMRLQFVILSVGKELATCSSQHVGSNILRETYCMN